MMHRTRPGCQRGRPGQRETRPGQIGRRPGRQPACLVPALLIILAGAIGAQESGTPHPPPRSTAIFPSPAPFTLDARAAQTCIEILRIEPFLLLRRDGEAPEIVRVREVYAWFAGFDESMPEGHRRRYDIRVNGQSLDWEHSYIEWGGEMVNMQLLFTYRNQYPPADLDFRME